MPLAIGTLMPSVDGVSQWLAGTFDPASYSPASADPLKCPLLIQFWAVSCPVCKMNVPRLLQLVQEYAPHGLRLVSVHMPRMEADMDVEKVRAAVGALGLTGPCAIDNAHALGERFQTGGVWPCYFLFDAEGRLRSRAAGALGLKMAENSLRRMLGTTEEATTAGAAA